MNNVFYFLRHAETKVDRNTPVSRWLLSKKGVEQANKRAAEGVFDDVNMIFSSDEEKAYQTAKPIADKLSETITRLRGINEIDRDGGAFLEHDEYENTIKQCVENPDKSFNNWETANHALERFTKQISELDKQFINKKILVVGHGLTINMYFAKLLGADWINDRLERNDFADWGVVKNQEVIQDIAK